MILLMAVTEENFIKLSNFLIEAEKEGNTAFSIPSLVAILKIPKQDILFILESLRKHKLCDAEIIPWDPPGHESFLDKFKEDRLGYMTDGFMLGKVNIKQVESLINSQEKLDKLIQEITPKPELPTFNKLESRLVFKGKTMELTGYQLFICEAVFDRKLGEWVNENDIAEKFDRVKESGRSIRDAVRNLNIKVVKEFNIPKLFEHKSSQVRLKTELFR